MNPGSALRALGFASAVLLCVSLPALIAGSQLDAAAADGELQRLAAAHAGTGGSEIARQFEVAMLPSVAEWPAERAAQLRLLGSARLMQVIGLFGISALLYLAMLLARGRLPAAVACIAFAALPAVYDVGYVLRPETASTLFAALALLLLQCMAQAIPGTPARGPWRRVVVLVLLASCAALAIGLAVGGVPQLDRVLLIPMALVLLSGLQLLLRGLRVGWRRGMLSWPARAVTRRLWPPALAAILAQVAALFCLLGSLRVPVDQVEATRLVTGVLPAPPVIAGGFVVVAIVGGLSFLIRTGIRFGRRGRLGADLVLLAYAGSQIVHLTAVDGRLDPLPAAPALALLIAEGAFGLVAAVAWFARRRSRA